MDDALFDGVEDLLERGAGMGLKFSPMTAEVRSFGMEHAWTEIGGGTVLLNDDEKLGVRYIEVTLDKGILQRFVFKLQMAVPVVPFADVMRKAEQALAEDPRWLQIAALVAPTGEVPELGSLVRDSLAASDREQRHHAIAACALLQWPEFITDLKRLIARESDEEIIENVRYALDCCIRLEGFDRGE